MEDGQPRDRLAKAGRTHLRCKQVGEFLQVLFGSVFGGNGETSRSRLRFGLQGCHLLLVQALYGVYRCLRLFRERRDGGLMGCG